MRDVRISAAPAPAGCRHLDASGSDTASGRDAAARLIRTLSEPDCAIDVTGLRSARLSAAVEGLLLGSHRLAAAGEPSGLITLHGVRDPQVVDAARRNATATLWARELANTPPRTKTPQWLAEIARGELERAGVAVDVREHAWLVEHGFGGLLAVGGAATAPPRLIHASWRPRDARRGVHVVLVGKGITFDTGGIDIKPTAAMRDMHTDMAGAAAVLAALRCAAQERLPLRITALVPAAENAVSGSAYRPGDVVRHVGGRTSEITNTDAEGRIVLADALAYAASSLAPTVLVDVATLTGAIKVALGLRVAGLFSTSDGLARALQRAGELSGEPVWRMPLDADNYAASLASPIADANNAPGNPGAITAALFLQPFTRDLPWAHLDIAGAARSSVEDGILARGATGFGARLLAGWLRSLA